jgi:hypothetical protein
MLHPTSLSACCTIQLHKPQLFLLFSCQHLSSTVAGSLMPGLSEMMLLSNIQASRFAKLGVTGP